jgi:adenine phosphoribosyltransferase
VTARVAEELKAAIRDVPDFPKRGILFRDISPLLKRHFAATIEALDGLLTDVEWRAIDAVAGIESRGFILGAALALRRGKGFVLVRKQGKLPPPVVDVSYALEYGSGVLEMQRGEGRLLLIDDVLATGGTLRASADLCLRAGYSVAALAVLIDLKLVVDYRWRDLPLRAVVDYQPGG